MLADNEIDLHTCRLAIWQAAWLLDQGERGRHESSLAKVFCSEALAGSSTAACRSWAGSASRATRWSQRSSARSAPFRIYDGPSEVHRHALARRIVWA